MYDNLLLLNSAIIYFEAERSAIAIADGDFKLVWFNKPFKNLLNHKRLKGISLFKLFGIVDSLKLNRNEIHFLPLRSEEHTSELQSLRHLVCRLLLEKKKK